MPLCGQAGDMGVALLRALVVFVLIAVVPEHARADDDTTVLALTLPVSGETVLVMPPGNTQWRAKDLKGEDFIESTAGDVLGLRLVQSASESCAKGGIGGAKLAGAPKIVERPAYLPDTFYPKAVESFSKAHLAVACADRARGSIVALIVSGRPLDDSGVVKRLKGLLESLGTTFGAQRKAEMAPAGPEQMTLAVTGVAVTLPEHWRATSQTPYQEEPYDELLRLDPTRPAIEIRLRLWDGGSCDRWLAGAKGRLKGTWQTNPPYRPRGYHAEVNHLTSGGSHQAVFCATLEQESLLVMAVHAGPLDGASFAEAKTVLERVAEQAGAAMPASPPPAIAQPVPSTPAPPIEPAPRAAVPPNDDDWSDGDDIFRAPATAVDVRAAYASPEGFDAIFAITANLAGGLFVADDDDIAFGLEMDYRLGIGVTTDGNIPFDVRFGVGPGLRLGPVTISPVVGLGIDTAGAGGDYDMGAAFYWYPGGRLRLGFEDFGLSGYAARTFRGNISADAASDVPNLTHVEARLWLGLDDILPFVGFHWTDVERFGVRTQFIGGMVGLGFPLDG